MKISGLKFDEFVWLNGRGRVRLMDVMAEAGIPYQEVGLPTRRYGRIGSVVLICGQQARPYECIEIATPDPNFTEDATPRVTRREPIPYVEAYGDLFEYDRGVLSGWLKRRKEQAPIFPRGYVILEVLGRVGDSALRVKLPHRSGEWQVEDRLVRWLDRVPSPLELRIQELWIEDPYRTDHRHPLSSAKYLVDDLRRERHLLTADGEPFNILAIEEWEELRQQQELSVDEAIIALSQALLSQLEDRGITYYSGPFTTEILEQYRKGAWSHRDPKDLLEKMGALHTMEYEMLRGAMRAVASTRRLYAQDTFDKLIGG